MAEFNTLTNKTVIDGSEKVLGASDAQDTTPQRYDLDDIWTYYYENLKDSLIADPSTLGSIDGTEELLGAEAGSFDTPARVKVSDIADLANSEAAEYIYDNAPYRVVSDLDGTEDVLVHTSSGVEKIGYDNLSLVRFGETNNAFNILGLSKAAGVDIGQDTVPAIDAIFAYMRGENKDPANTFWYVPPHVYEVDAPIILDRPLIGIAGRGPVVFKPSATFLSNHAGKPLFYTLPNAPDGWSYDEALDYNTYRHPNTEYAVQNISCFGTPTSDPANADDFIGFDFGYGDYTGSNGGFDPGENHVKHAVSRVAINNLEIKWAKVGLQAVGWVSSWYGIYTARCGIGAKFFNFKDIVIEYATEECGQGMRMEQANGVEFIRYSDEGGHYTDTSTIDACTGVTIQHYRTEVGDPTQQDYPWLSVGTDPAYLHSSTGDATVRGFQINNGMVGRTNDGVTAIVLDKLDGYRIGCLFRRPTLDGTWPATYGLDVSRTANTINEYEQHKSWYRPIAYADSHKAQYPVANLHPNPNRRGWSIGYDAFVKPPDPEVTFTEETTITFGGNPSASKALVASSGETVSYVGEVITDPSIISKLAGNTVTFAAWVYIPNTGRFASREDYYQLGIRYDGTPGSPTNDVYNPNQRIHEAYTQDYWHLYYTVVEDMPSDITETTIYHRIVTQGSSLGGEYIIVGKSYILLGDHARACETGRVETTADSVGEYLPNNLINYRIPRAEVSDAKSRPRTDWHIGDRITYTDPIAGDYMGEICTVAGVPGTWKKWGAIEA